MTSTDRWFYLSLGAWMGAVTVLTAGLVMW